MNDRNPESEHIQNPPESNNRRVGGDTLTEMRSALNGKGGDHTNSMNTELAQLQGLNLDNGTLSHAIDGIRVQIATLERDKTSFLERFSSNYLTHTPVSNA